MRRKWTYGLLLAVILVFGLTLSGCDFFQSLGDLFYPDNNAEAQAGGRLIQTFDIAPSSFELRTDVSVTPTFVENIEPTAVIYDIESPGRVDFLVSGGSQQSIILQAGDTVTEYPSLNKVTVDVPQT
jgi:hypothetical protein